MSKGNNPFTHLLNDTNIFTIYKFNISTREVYQYNWYLAASTPGCISTAVVALTFGFVLLVFLSESFVAVKNNGLCVKLEC